MSGKKTNYYNVIKDCELIKTGVTNQEAAAISGCDPGQISSRAKAKKSYRGKDGVFIFEVCKSVFAAPSTEIKKVVDMDNKCFFLPEKLEREWNNMRTAAKLLKTGHGKLITKNGKKCVVMV